MVLHSTWSKSPSFWGLQSPPPSGPFLLLFPSLRLCTVKSAPCLLLWHFNPVCELSYFSAWIILNNGMVCLLLHFFQIISSSNASFSVRQTYTIILFRIRTLFHHALFMPSSRLYFSSQCLSHYACYIIVCDNSPQCTLFFLAMSCHMQHLSSSIRDWTRAPCNGSVEP